MEDRDYPMTVEMLMKYLHCSRLTVWKYFKSGKIPAKKIGKRWITMKSQVDKFLLDYSDK